MKAARDNYVNNLDMKRVIRKADIDQLKNETSKVLKMHYRHNRELAGWHQYLGSEKIGTVATAQVLLLMKYLKEDFNYKVKVENSLLESQIRSASNDRINGGWGFVTNFPGMATTEATCMALQALHAEYARHSKVLAGLRWLLRTVKRSYTDEGWGIMPGDVSRVYTTCLALTTLNMFGHVNLLEYQRGLNWILKIQNPDGGWGSKAGCPSNITYTSRVLITMNAIGQDMNSEPLKSATQWLKDQAPGFIQLKNNVGIEHRECIEFEGRRLYFHHMPVQTALTALILSGNTKSFTVFDGVNDLVQHNNNYYWSHPSFNDGKRKPLCAIYETLMVCKALQDTTYNWPALQMLQSQGRKLTLTEASHPFSYSIFKENFIRSNWGKIFLVLCICLISYRIINTFPKLGTMTYLSLVIFPLLIELLGYYITEIRKNKRTQMD